MTIELELMKRGSLADGSVETMYRSSISASETEDLHLLERLFRKVLAEELGFVSPPHVSGEREPYHIWILYDVKEDAYLFDFIERKKCITVLKRYLSVDM